MERKGRPLRAGESASRPPLAIGLTLQRSVATLLAKGGTGTAKTAARSPARGEKLPRTARSSADKAADLASIFQSLRAELARFEPRFTVRTDFDSRYELWSEKPVEIAGRKRDEVFFASLIIQSSYVGLYYMPVYANASLKDVFEPELLSLLKGKSCFHVKKLDTRLLRQVRKALRVGFDLYRKRGWV